MVFNALSYIIPLQKNLLKYDKKVINFCSMVLLFKYKNYFRMTTTEAIQSMLDLTNKNLDILKTINDAFFTKKSHVVYNDKGTNYIIPSFIHLENKINHLQDAFNNLVNAPASGEAWFQFDGNSRAIEVRNYQAAPNPIHLTDFHQKFYSKKVDIFRDFLSPVPYYKLQFPQIPDDINSVVVKKIIIYTKDSYALVSQSNEVSQKISYNNFHQLVKNDRILSSDFKEVDSIHQLPIRKQTSGGTFTIDTIKEDFVSPELEQMVVLTIKEAPQYTIFDGNTKQTLIPGDQLTTFDGSAKLTIISIHNQELTLKVNNAEYLNLKSDGSDYGKLRFYKSKDFTSDKYLDIPLEEDRYVAIFVMPLNTRMNIQSEVGDGVLLDTHKLLSEDGSIDFKTHYQNNVKNIGDILFEISHLYNQPISQLLSEEYGAYLNLKPSLFFDGIYTFKVSQINKHINSSEGEVQIKDLYSTKKQREVERQALQSQISQLELDKYRLNSKQDYEAIKDIDLQIKELTNKRNNIDLQITSILHQMKSISVDATIGLGLNKYHIRGWVDLDKNIKSQQLEVNKAIGIEVLYRYKSPNSPTNNTLTHAHGQLNYLNTEWNLYSPPFKNKKVDYHHGEYHIQWEDFDAIKNDIKFNQMEIPIEQGDSVDIKVRFVWDFGYPLVKIYSQWSDIIQVDFPEELKSNPLITEILSETNQEIKQKELSNLLEEKGLISHIADSFKDYESNFVHQADNISSGFFTEDRKVIPLKEKLSQLSSDIALLKDSMGNADGDLEVGFSLNGVYTKLNPHGKNIIGLPPAGSTNSSGDISVEDGVNGDIKDVLCKAFITFKNKSSAPIKLYTIFGGSRQKLSAMYDYYDTRDVLYHNFLSQIHTSVNYMFKAGRPNYFNYYSSMINLSKSFGNNSIEDPIENQFLYFNERSPIFTLGETSDYEFIHNYHYRGGDHDLETGVKNYIQFLWQVYSKLTNREQLQDKHWFATQEFNGLRMAEIEAALNLIGPNFQYIYSKPVVFGGSEMLSGNRGNGDVLTLAPGEEIIQPILINYVINNSGGDNTYFLKFTQGFTIRPYIFKEPVYYEIEYRAAYHDNIILSGARTHKYTP